MVPFQPPIQHVPPMSTLLPNPLWVPALFTPSTVGSSHTRLSNTCAAPAPTRLWTPPFAYGLPIFIYLFIYYYFIVFLPSHCGVSCHIWSCHILSGRTEYDCNIWSGQNMATYLLVVFRPPLQYFVRPTNSILRLPYHA